MPDLWLRIIITKPSGYRIRVALLTAILWVAGRVAPSNIDVETEIVTNGHGKQNSLVCRLVVGIGQVRSD